MSVRGKLKCSIVINFMVVAQNFKRLTKHTVKNVKKAKKPVPCISAFSLQDKTINI